MRASICYATLRFELVAIPSASSKSPSSSQSQSSAGGEASVGDRLGAALYAIDAWSTAAKAATEQR